MRAASEHTDLVELKEQWIPLVDDDHLNLRILCGILQNECYVLTDLDSAVVAKFL